MIITSQTTDQEIEQALSNQTLTAHLFQTKGGVEFDFNDSPNPTECFQLKDDIHRGSWKIKDEDIGRVASFISVIAQVKKISEQRARLIRIMDSTFEREVLNVH